jgi:hypothetical protein
MSSGRFKRAGPSVGIGREGWTAPSPRGEGKLPQENNQQQVAIMLKTLIVLVLVIPALMLTFAAHAEEVSKAQMKGLDEQIQDVKTDVLGIAVDLNQLEEKLLYPSNTEVCVFVSLAQGEKFRLDSLKIQLGGKPVANHLYTFRELEALRKGGVQRIYTGNIRTGAHDMKVTLLGKSAGGADIRRTKSFKVVKDVGPKIVEITLSQQSITFKDW